MTPDEQATTGLRIYDVVGGRPYVAAVDRPEPWWPVIPVTADGEVHLVGDDVCDPGVCLADVAAANLDVERAMPVGLRQDYTPVCALDVTAQDTQRLAGVLAAADPARILTALPVRALLAGPPATARILATAMGLLRNRRTMAFDPRTGSPLTWDATGTHARSARGDSVFPRLEPSVIGLVAHDGDDGQRRVLVVKDRRRTGYFSCIAGYVEHGESFEEAFLREVYEETGLIARSPRYVTSAPWPMTGCIMVGLTAVVGDTTPVYGTDGEIIESRWCTADELGRSMVVLPGPGSVARRLIDDFIAGHLPFG